GHGRPDLTAVVEAALATSTGGADGTVGIPVWARGLADGPGQLGDGSPSRLFCGGTLADEAMVIAGERLGPVWSNVPLSPRFALPPDLRSPSPLVIDFGADALTR